MPVGFRPIVIEVSVSERSVLIDVFAREFGEVVRVQFEEVTENRLVAERCRHAVKAQGQAMNLLVIFIITLVIGQSLSVGLGLLVERYSTPYTGMVTFIGSYFVMFWLAWRFAVRITAPRSPERGGLSSAGKSSASEAA